MLEIINTLKPFFDDNYRRINVREYARLQKMSPPTSSRLLETMHKEGLLKKEEDKRYKYYRANINSELLIDFSRIYWRTVLEKAGVVREIEDNFLNPVIILFGSLSKAEAKKDSDVDLAVFSASKEIALEKYERSIKRRIQIFHFKNTEQVENKELLKNILNGYRLKGAW